MCCNSHDRVLSLIDTSLRDPEFAVYKGFAIALTAASLFFMALLVFTMAGRVGYPAELELIEGSMVNHSLRILEGQALFVQPSFEFAPNIYTPLFYYVGAAVAWVQGIGFESLRIVSVAATFLTAAICALFAWRESGSRVSAVAAAGFYSATYAASGGWMDLARVDSLFVMFLLLSAYFLRFAQSRRGLCCAAACFLLAYLSKQSALIALGPFILYRMLFPVAGASRWFSPLLLAGSLALTVLVIDLSTQHWFIYYTVIVPAGHPNNGKHLTEFFVHDLLAVMPIALALALALVVQLFVRNRRREAIFYGLFLTAMFVLALATRYNKGGVYNNLMPLHACLAVMLGTLLGQPRRNAQQAETVRYGVLAALVLAQFAMLGYWPADYWPTAQDRKDNDQLVDTVRHMPGNVFGGDLGFIGYQAGKENYIHSTAYGDLNLSRNKNRFDIGAFAILEGQFQSFMEGFERHDVRIWLEVEENKTQPEATKGSFMLKQFRTVPAREHTHPWFIRDWPERTYFSPPTVAIYTREK